MIDLIKKILEKIGLILFVLVIGAIALGSLLLGLGSVAEIVIKIVKIAGGGSIGLGIIMAPFFIFGVVQLFRGLCAIIDSDIKKIDASNESLWHYLYLPATIIGTIVVIVALWNWSAGA